MIDYSFDNLWVELDFFFYNLSPLLNWLNFITYVSIPTPPPLLPAYHCYMPKFVIIGLVERKKLC